VLLCTRDSKVIVLDVNDFAEETEIALEPHVVGLTICSRSKHGAEFFVGTNNGSIYQYSWR
jgi:hypothetical protein